MIFRTIGASLIRIEGKNITMVICGHCVETV